jgi:hypothetical protein
MTYANKIDNNNMNIITVVNKDGEIVRILIISTRRSYLKRPSN